MHTASPARLNCRTHTLLAAMTYGQNGDSYTTCLLVCVRRSTPRLGQYQPENRVICAAAQPTQTGGSEQIHKTFVSTTLQEPHPGTYHEGSGWTKWHSSNVSLTTAIDRGGWSTPRLGRFNHEKDTRYPLYRKLGGHQSWFRWVRNISPPRRFDPQTVQTAKSCYTNCTNPAYNTTLPTTYMWNSEGHNFGTFRHHHHDFNCSLPTNNYNDKQVQSCISAPN